MFAEALVGWLVQLVGDASLRKGTRILLGDEEEAGIRAATMQAVAEVTQQVPEPARAALQAALDERFANPPPLRWLGDRSMGEALAANIQAVVAQLADPAVTGTGESFLDGIGADPDVLRKALPAALIAALIRLAATGSPALAPLAAQLNAEAVFAKLEAIHASVMEAPAPVVISSLPGVVRRFTGRRKELEWVRKSLQVSAHRPGVVMITAIDGMAGVGKTAFAVAAAHELAPSYPDGQLFINLHGYAEDQTPVSPGAALEALLLAIGLGGAQLPPDLEARSLLWRAKLSGRRLLLVLDNAASSGQVRPLLPGSPTSLVLITSRRRLDGIPEAEPLPLDTLPDGDAIELFAQVAGLGPQNEQLDVVAQIVRRCGNLPLAIQLLASRLRHHPRWRPVHLLAEIDEADDDLTPLQAEGLDVGLAIGLSYRGLPEAERELFRLLGAFPGVDVTRHVAGALCDIPPHRADRLLDSLYGHNLLLEPQPGRYRMHDLVRAYAVRIAPRPATAALTRVLRRFIQVLRDAQPLLRDDGTVPDSTMDGAASVIVFRSRNEASRWLEMERPSLLACTALGSEPRLRDLALELADLLAPYLQATGRATEALGVQEFRLEAVRAAGDVAAEATVLLDLARTEDGIDRYDDALGHYDHACTLATQLDLQEVRATALSGIAGVRYSLGLFDQALPAYEEALDLYRDVEDRVGEARTLVGIAGVESLKGLLPSARMHYEQALTAYTELEDERGRRRPYWGWASWTTLWAITPQPPCTTTAAWP